MLKSCLAVKENVNVNNLPKTTAFLKRESIGYTPKKSKVLTADKVAKFPPDKNWLFSKVILIFGVYVDYQSGFWNGSWPNQSCARTGSDVMHHLSSILCSVTCVLHLVSTVICVSSILCSVTCHPSCIVFCVIYPVFDVSACVRLVKLKKMLLPWGFEPRTSRPNRWHSYHCAINLQ